jgi:serine phosphatase RsbU (regulator of sigma subunit)
MDRPQLIHSHKGGNSFEYVKTTTKMLETLDAENFCSGHSDMISRQEVLKHVEQMKKRQAAVMALVKEGKTLEEIQKEFEENELRLVGSIYHEITNK